MFVTKHPPRDYMDEAMNISVPLSWQPSVRTERHYSDLHLSEKRSLVCVICGACARGYNFGAITCMSCKIFFRRNALTKLERFSCQHNGHCNIDENTRRHCTYCRIHACFRLGMRTDLIRKNRDHGGAMTKPVVDKPSCMRSMSTYQRIRSHSIKAVDGTHGFDRFQLSNSERFLLHRLSSIFDCLTYRATLNAHEIYYQLSTRGIQPLKIRVKASPIYQMIHSWIDGALEFITLLPQYGLLPSPNRQVLLTRHTPPFIMYYIHYQMNLSFIQPLTQMPCWLSSFECMFRPSIRHLFGKLNTDIGQLSSADPHLLKLIPILLTFSANSINGDEPTPAQQQLDEHRHACVVQRIQNIYIEITWKYMISRFGESAAVRLLSTLLRTIFRVQSLVSMVNQSGTIFERRLHERIVQFVDRTVR